MFLKNYLFLIIVVKYTYKLPFKLFLRVQFSGYWAGSLASEGKSWAGEESLNWRYKGKLSDTRISSYSNDWDKWGQENLECLIYICSTPLPVPLPCWINTYSYSKFPPL